MGNVVPIHGHTALADGGLGVVTLTGTQTLTNKTLISPVLTTPQINNLASTFQYVVTPTAIAADRIATLPLLTGDDTFVFEAHTQTLTNKTLTSPVLTTPQINDAAANHQYIFAVNDLTDDRTVTLPLLGGNDEFVFKDHAQVLTNKTLTTPTIGSFVNAGHNHTNAAGGGALTQSKAFTIENPTASENLGLWFTDVAITISKIRAVVVGAATSCTFNIYFGTNRSDAGTAVMGSSLVATPDDGDEVTGGWADNTVDATKYLFLKSSAIAGTPTELNVTIYYAYT